MTSPNKYSEKLKAIAPYNELILQKIKEWDICNAFSMEFVLNKNTGELTSFTKPENPHLALTEIEKDVIMMEFIKVMKYEGYNCDHTDRWKVTLVDRSWRLPVDVEELMPFTESTITHIDEHHRNHMRSAL